MSVFGRRATGEYHEVLVDDEGRVITVEENSYLHVIADTQVKASPGALHTLTINSCGTAGTLTLYDDPAEAGDVIAAIVIPITQIPVTLTYDIEFTTALYVGYDGTLVADITISYR